MIATILPGSRDFHAVGYNNRKVSKGVARLLEIKDFGAVGLYGPPSTAELASFLQRYSGRNPRIRKPQFHVAFSCKGREMTEAELLVFAHKWLEEMGYMNPGQPLLVYSHHDTENNHLHIVTSRVAPDGRKIEHSHERRRSQEVIDRILNTDLGEKTELDIETAKRYGFSSFPQFKAVMRSMGYEIYNKDDVIYIKKGGSVKKTLPLSEISTLYINGTRDRKRCSRLRSILRKYRDVNGSREELQTELKKKFGVDLVFFGRKDNPYGYMIVDHRNRIAINGARVLSTEELLDFATPEERFDRIEDFIDRLFTLNPKITQKEIHGKLWKQHARIKKGVICFDGKERKLKPFMAKAIDRNNRIAYVEMFHPAGEAERDVLCGIFKVERSGLVSLSGERTKEYAGAVDSLKKLFDDKTKTGGLRGELYSEGFIVRQAEETYFAIDFKRHIIVNLNEEGLDIHRVKKQEGKNRKAKPSVKPKLPKTRDAGGGSRDEKREWEVGMKGNYDEVDDGRSLKR